MKSRILTILGLFCIVVLLIVLINYRYKQLKTRVDITRYFDNTAYILSFLRKNDFGKELSPIPEPVKLQPGNLLPEVSRYVPPLAKYTFYDPFPPAEEPRRIMELRFGQARHIVSASDFILNSTAFIQSSTHTFWLIWSAGPSRISPDIRIQPGTTEYPLYQFLSPPYDVTNGIWSRGYLYIDSRGGVFGKIRG